MATARTSDPGTILHEAAALLSPDDGDFVGRGFVRDAIAHFRSVQNRMLVLVGPPGVGKTALALDLVRASLATDNPYLAHFCAAPGKDNPYTFCAALAEQLYDRFGSDYSLPDTARRQTVNLDIDVRVGQAGENVLVKGLDLNIGGMHPREAFRQAVREPLRAYSERAGAQPAHADLVIVVDALDHAWEWDGGQGGNIVSVLGDAQDLPPWVTLICTARPGKAVQALRARAGVQVFEIDPKSKSNLDDVATFLNERFIGRLSATQRATFTDLLAAGQPPAGGDDLTPAARFVDSVVAASEGNFLYVRRYVDAWRNVLAPDGTQQPLDPAVLLDFGDGHGSLDSMLKSSFAALYADLQPRVERDVLVALATAFEPIDLALLGLLSARPTSTVVAALAALQPVLEQRGADEADRTYRFYYRGFAEYVRAQNMRLAREIDRRAAQALEVVDRGDARARDYSQRFRWSHLLRGLDLVTGTPRPGRQPSPGSTDTALGRATVAQVVEQVPDVLTQARVLRELAARALQPAHTGQPGSWANALDALSTAERGLRRSRALLQFRRFGWRAVTPVATAALIEYERTLIALGDAYATIVERMDAGMPRSGPAPGIAGRIQVIWDYLVQAPVTLYLLVVIAREGVREIHLPGVLQNLGRGQDWTVARLCVLSVSAYRRAHSLAGERGADDVADDISERLARLYALMGAFKAAAATYESLLSRPGAMMSLWRQAVWRLAMGEVLVTQRANERAVEVLNSALPTFEQQAAPVLRARALTALAVAYYQQAAVLGRRGDPRAADLDDKTLASCDEALRAWQDVTQLPEDDSANVDPGLAVTRIGHYLWMMSDDPRMGSEQQRTARLLLDSIKERHYPQRFEHPVLRFFRVGAAAVLPLVVLAGLLLAVQIPSSVAIRRQAVLPIQAPLVDLSRVANPIIYARDVFGSAGDTSQEPLVMDVSTQVELGDPRQGRTEAPALDQVAITWLVLRYLGYYLLAYVLCGLLIITRSRPERLQSRLPGRLILSDESLQWRGAANRGSWQQTWSWLMQMPRAWAADLGRRVPAPVRARIERHWPRVGRFPLLPPDTPPAAPGARLAYGDIGGMVVVERRLFGYVLHDLSLRVVQPRDTAAQPIALYGTVAHYEELSQELERRARVPIYRYGVELIRSTLGLMFWLTLLYSFGLVLLLPVAPELLRAPLPGVVFSVSHLYVLVTPGLLIPLAWWFVAQPLGASGRILPTMRRLVLTALVAGFLTITVGRSRGALLSVGLKPDLATPIMALGCLGSLVLYGPTRGAMWQALPRRSRWLRGAIAGLAGIGLIFVLLQIGVAVLWYDALVRGNVLVERAMRTPDCAAGSANCASDLADATAMYTRMICLGPGYSDGYTLRGFAYLAQGAADSATVDFGAALNQKDAIAQAAPACSNVVRMAPFARAGPKQIVLQTPRLQANLGSAWALRAQHAQAEGRQDEADEQMQKALGYFAQALDLRKRDLPPDAGGTWIERGLGLVGVRIPPRIPPDRVLDNGEPLDCALVTRHLLAQTDHQLDLLGPPAELAPSKASAALQFADACYSRGAGAARALQRPATSGTGVVPPATWQDLASALHVYKAVAATTTSPADHELAERAAAAAWLTLSQVNPAPLDEPDRRSRALQMLEAYRRLSGPRQSPTPLASVASWLASKPAAAPDEQVYAGLAWSAIQLGTWDVARQPLTEARRLDPLDPLYPALQGLVAWLDSTQYAVATKERPSPEWTQSMREAVAAFDQVIALGGDNLSRAHATRAFLYTSLRNSPRGATYQDADYVFSMRQAVADMDRALLEAQSAGLSKQEQVAYRYFRGRVCFSLALTLQKKERGDFKWTELIALYSQALDDFDTAVPDDPLKVRRDLYQTYWRPWAQTMLLNATQIQQARRDAADGDYAAALAALERIDRDPRRAATWSDPLAVPRVDYAFLRGIYVLGSAAGARGTTALTETLDRARGSLEDGIARTEGYLPDAESATRDDARRTIYRAALADLRALLKQPPANWSSRARDAARAYESRLVLLLDRIS